MCKGMRRCSDKKCDAVDVTSPPLHSHRRGLANCVQLEKVRRRACEFQFGSKKCSTVVGFVCRIILSQWICGAGSFQALLGWLEQLSREYTAWSQAGGLDLCTCELLVFGIGWDWQSSPNNYFETEVRCFNFYNCPLSTMDARQISPPPKESRIRLFESWIKLSNHKLTSKWGGRNGAV